ncbi:MAG: PKD domain-containing protein [Vicingaceae bacterium]
MIEGKDIFSSKVKEQLDNVEVPYNEKHWDEMNEMLDKIPASALKGKSSNTGYYVVAGAVAILAVGYFIMNKQTEESQIPNLDDQEVLIESPQENNSQLPGNSEVENLEEDIQVPVQGAVEVRQESQVNGVDKKVDRYAGLTEEQLKEEAKASINQVVQAQSVKYEDSPNLDNPALKSNIVIKTSTLCAGSTVEFSVDPVRDDVTYFWDFGDKGLKSRKANASHTFNKAGSYDLLLVVSKKGVEKNTYTAHKTIRVNKSPELKMELDQELITLNDPYLEVRAFSDVPCTFNWTFNEQQKAIGKQASFIVPDKGSFAIQLDGLGDAGCNTQITEFYAADKGVHIIVESAFAPDNGLGNEEFLPKELNEADVDFVFVIRDRTGNVVFESREKYKGWNGRMNNVGNPMPAGPYQWSLSFKDDKGQEHIQKGKINLLR